MSRELVVATIPAVGVGNPYVNLLERSVEPLGVDYRRFSRLRLRDLDGLDVIHLHWVEYLYGSRLPRPVATALSYYRGLMTTLRMRALGRKRPAVVWTAHNLRPHDSGHSRLDRLTFQAASRAADKLIFHSDHAARSFCETYGVDPGKAVTIPHGNYTGVYPKPSAARERLRAELGYEDSTSVLLAFGQVRGYKRLPELIRTVTSASGADIALIVAGRPTSRQQAEQVRHAAGASARIRLELEFITDQRASDLHAACDAAVLNYRDVFSSGALLLAWSLGLPVLAPAGTTADELGQVGAVETFREGELVAGLERIRSGSRLERRQAALKTAQAFAWDRLAVQVRATYDAALLHHVKSGRHSSL